MSDNQNRIPSFNEVMQRDTVNGKIPSFHDIMGEQDEPPVKKKEGGIWGSIFSGALEGGVQAGALSSIGKKKTNKDKVIEYIESIRTPEERANKIINATSTKPKAIVNISTPGKKVEIKEKDYYNAGDAIIGEMIKTELPDARSAKRFLARKGQVDPTNELDVVADKMVKDYEASTQNLLTSSSIKEAALKEAVAKGDLPAKQIQELNGDIPKAMMGNIILNYLQSPNIQELMLENREVANKVRQELFDLPNNYPEAAVTILSQMISQERENRGMGNAILNITSGKKNTEIVNDLVREGKLPPQYKAFYEKPEVAYSVDKNLKTPGFIENFGTGVKQGILGIGKSVSELTGLRSLYKSKDDQLYDALAKDYEDFQFKPKSILHDISTHGGLITGQVSTLVGGGGLLKAAGLVKNVAVANSIMAGLQSFGYNKERAIVEFPGASEAKQFGYATMLTSAEVAFANVFNDLKYARQLTAKAAPSIKQVINKFSNKEITEAAAKQSIKDIFYNVANSASKFAGGTVKVANKEAIEEAATDIVQTGSNQVFGGEPIEFSQAAQRAFETYRTSFLGSLVLGIGGGVSSLRNDFSTPKLVYEMASNPQKYKEIIKSNAIEDEDYAKEAPMLLKNLDFAASIKEELDRRPEMKQAAKEKYVLNSLKEKILTEEIEAIPDKMLKKETEKQLKEVEIEKKAILEPDTSNTRLVEEFYNEDLLPKGMAMILNDENGKFSESKVGEFLKFIAQQSNNLDENWQPHKDKAPSMGNIPQAIIDIANKRWAKEIQAADQKEIDEIKISPVPRPESVNQHQSLPDLAVKVGDFVEDKSGDRFIVKEIYTDPYIKKPRYKLEDENGEIKIEGFTPSYKLSSDKPVSVKTIGSEIESVLNNYDQSEIATIGDLANELEAIEDIPKEIEDAVNKYREEQAYDMEVSGRNDMDAAEAAFEQAVRGYVASNTKELVEYENIKETTDVNDTVVGSESIYDNNKELSKIGTSKEYSDYLKSIFPDSKVKDVVYHGTNAKFEQFNDSPTGISFATDINHAKRQGRNVVAAIVNLKNPETSKGLPELNRLMLTGKSIKDYKEHDGFYSDESTGGLTKEANVTTSDQVHILGSKKDVEGFKKWKKQNETTTKASDKSTEPKSTEKSSTSKEKTDSTGGEAIPPTEGKAEVADDEGDNGGITHAANEIRRADRRLPEYERTPQSFEQWNNEAEQLIKEGYDVEKLMDKIQEGHDPTPVENAIRKIYIATLDAEISKNPTDELLAKQKRFIEIGDLANSRAGRNLVSLKGEGSPLETISDFYVARMEALGVDKLTDQQKKETKELFDKSKEAEAQADAKLKILEDEVNSLRAENELLKQKKESKKPREKKTHEDFVKERDSYREELKKAKEKHEQWLKDQGMQKSGVGFTLTGDMVKAISKIVKSHVDEKVQSLKEVIQNVYEDIKDIFPGITETDIRDIIAGQYNDPRPTKNELAARMRDLRDEAYYAGKLERLLAGAEPNSEKKRTERNREITDLQQKIKSLQKDAPKTDEDLLKRLQSIKERNEREADKIQERIRKGDFEKKKTLPFLEDPEIKKKFPKEYKDALDAIVKKEDARHELDIALMKDEMSKRSLAKKGIDLVGDIIGTSRALVTGIDASGIGIQNLVAMVAHPRSAATALPSSFSDFFSAKNQERWLASVHSSSIYPLAQKSGLDITEPKSLKASQKEELFTKNMLDRKIKFKGKTYIISKYLTKPFERIFTGLGNRMRWNLWQRGVEKLFEKGYTWESHPEEFESLAKVLNTETGRGKLHSQIEKSYGLVSAVIWSPRLMASRLNILGLGDVGNFLAGGKKGYYGGLTPRMRAYAIKDAAKFIGFGLLMLTLAGLSFADDVDLDPNSSTFGTFSVDGKRYNIWGGFTQYVRLIAKYITGGEKRKEEFVKTSPLGNTLRFFWSKTTPAVGEGIGWINKDRYGNSRDYMGQPKTIGGTVEGLVTPLSIRGIERGLQEEGISSILWTGVPSFVGVNVNYEADFADKDSSPLTIKDPDTFKERKATKEEYKKFTEKSEEIENDLMKEYRSGQEDIWVDVNGKIHISKEGTSKDEVDTWEDVRFNKLTEEQVKSLESKIKAKATRDAKKELFSDDSQ